MDKMRVDVSAIFADENRLDGSFPHDTKAREYVFPLSVAHDGHTYEIKHILASMPYDSGSRFVIEMDGKEWTLFLEGRTWFAEIPME